MPRRGFLLLFCLAACRPPPSTATPDDSDDDPASTIVDGPPATVLFLDSAGRAVPLACAAPGVGHYLSPDDCVELLGDDRTLGDLGNGRRTLGDPANWFCATNKTSRPAFRIDAAPGRAFEDGDPANDLVVWPAARAFDITVWTREASPSPADPSLGAPNAKLFGTLRIDLDGDDLEDVLYSVGSSAGPHRVVASLSTVPGEAVVLMSDDEADLQAFAAVDLDGDKRAEVVVSAPYADGDWTAVERYDSSSQSLVAISGIGCGPS
jgi:hypothetical protein